jgi:hypothetical protein
LHLTISHGHQSTLSTRRIGPRCQPSPGVARNAKAFARGPCWSRRWRGMTREGPELKLGRGFGLGRHADHSRAAIMPRSAMACHRGDSHADSTVRTVLLHKPSDRFVGDTESKRARFSERKTLEKRRSLAEWRSMTTCCGQGRSTAAHGTAAMQVARRHRPSSDRVPLATPSVP